MSSCFLASRWLPDPMQHHGGALLNAREIQAGRWWNMCLISSAPLPLWKAPRPGLNSQVREPSKNSRASPESQDHTQGLLRGLDLFVVVCKLFGKWAWLDHVRIHCQRLFRFWFYASKSLSHGAAMFKWFNHKLNHNAYAEVTTAELCKPLPCYKVTKYLWQLWNGPKKNSGLALFPNLAAEQLPKLLPRLGQQERYEPAAENLPRVRCCSLKRRMFVQGTSRWVRWGWVVPGSAWKLRSQSKWETPGWKGCFFCGKTWRFSYKFVFFLGGWNLKHVFYLESEI